MSINGTVFVSRGGVETEAGNLNFVLPSENKFQEFVSAIEAVAGALGPQGYSIRAISSNEERSHIYQIVDDDSLEQAATFENPTSVRIVVSTSESTKKVEVIASIRGAAEGAATFGFEFTPTQDSILETFKAEAAKHLGLEDNSAVSVFVSTSDDTDAEVNGDRVFLELLIEHLQEATPIKVGIQTNTRTKMLSIAVDSIFEDGLVSKNEHFDFNYTIDQEQLLSSLKHSCATALDIDEGSLDLTAVIEGDDVAIQSDQQLRDILFSLLDVKQITVRATRSKPSARITSIPVEVSFGDKKGNFTFRYNMEDTKVLTNFKNECTIELELNSTDDFSLEIISSDNEPILILGDKQLEDVFLNLLNNPTAEGTVATVHAKLTSIARSQNTVKKIACSMGGETAYIDFVFTADQEGLLAYLTEECKAPFELFPNDEVTLFAILGDEEFPIVQDAQLVEILTKYEGDVINLRMVDAKEVQKGPTEKKVTFTVTQEEETSQTVITYDPSNTDGLLDRIVNEIKSDLFLDADRNVAIYIVGVDSFRTILNSVEQVTSLDNNAVVPLDVHVLGEAPQELDRQGELEVLGHEWSDILEATFDAQDMHQVFGLLKTSEGVSLPSSDPLNVHLTDFASKNRPQPISELLPILIHWTSHMTDEEVASFCHQCRDVIDFMVSVSNAFRLRRALSSAFRSLAVAGSVSTQELSRLLLDTGNFEPDAVEQVVDGSPSQLSQIEFNEVMTQLLGDRPQDIIDFLSAAKDVAHPSTRRLEKEIGVLRRKRLRADILHTMDGVSPYVLINVANDFAKTTDEVALSLFHCVAVLLVADCSKPEDSDANECKEWVVGNVSDEDAAKAFTHRLTHFTNASISHRKLTDVCHRLLSPELEPSALLQKSTGCWALGRWALKAAQLVCHNKRVPFPPVPIEKFVPKPPSTDSPTRPLTSGGLSSPSRLRAQLAATRFTGAVVPSSPPNQTRYDFRFTHLCRDLGLSEDLPAYSLKELLPPRPSPGAIDSDGEERPLHHKPAEEPKPAENHKPAEEPKPANADEQVDEKEREVLLTKSDAGAKAEIAAAAEEL